MARSPTPFEELMTFHSLLVAERRLNIRTALELRETNRDSGPTSLSHNWGAEFKAIQEQIEAVDRAMADEGKSVA